MQCINNCLRHNTKTTFPSIWGGIVQYHNYAFPMVPGSNLYVILLPHCQHSKSTHGGEWCIEPKYSLFVANFKSSLHIILAAHNNVATVRHIWSKFQAWYLIAHILHNNGTHHKGCLWARFVKNMVSWAKGRRESLLFTANHASLILQTCIKN